MTYNKPEVVKLDSALSVIQGVDKGTLQPFDNQVPRKLQTIGAYESDE